MRIVIGASGVFDAGWIPTDIDIFNILDEGDWQRYFAPNSIDALLAEHVWEHLTPQDGCTGARLCYRYLKPGGVLRIAVPDGLHPDPNYIEWVRVGGNGPGAEDHKVLYDYCSLKRLFEEAGFEVRLLEYFDETRNFQAEPWDPHDGMIHRSKQFDERNQDGALHYTSLILDARKPAPSPLRPN